MTTLEATGLVLAELARAQAKHHDFHSGHEGYGVILEELDELWDAIKADKQFLRYSGAPAKEAVQVAAMAIRFLVDLCDYDGAAAFVAGQDTAKPQEQLTFPVV
jgi:hypothetical protein